MTGSYPGRRFLETNQRSVNEFPLASRIGFASIPKRYGASFFDVIGDMEAFSTRYFGKQPLLKRSDDPGRFIEMLNWELLAMSVKSHAIDPMSVRVTVNRQDLPDSTYIGSDEYQQRVLVARGIARHLRGNASIVIDRANNLSEACRCFAYEMEYYLHRAVQANAYIATGVEPGFGLHWDDHDTYICQTLGTKLWTIYEPTVEAPIRDALFEVPEPSEPPIMSVLLTPGDFLYVPRGFWHNVEPVGEATIHVTFGAPPMTGSDLLESIIYRLRLDPAMRTELPIVNSQDERRVTSDHLAAIVNGALGGDAIESFVRFRDSRIMGETPPSIQTASEQSFESDEVEVRILVRRPIEAYQVGPDSPIVLCALDKEFWIGAESREAVLRILSGEWCLLSQLIDLIPGIDPGVSLQAFMELVDEGLLAIQPSVQEQFWEGDSQTARVNGHRLHEPNHLAVQGK
jgi:JmjC domain